MKRTMHFYREVMAPDSRWEEDRSICPTFYEWGCRLRHSDGKLASVLNFLL